MRTGCIVGAESSARCDATNLSNTACRRLRLSKTSLRRKPGSGEGVRIVRSVGMPPNTMSSTIGIRNFASRSGMIVLSVSHRATMRCPRSCANFRSRTRLKMRPPFTSGKFVFCIIMKSNGLHSSAMFWARSRNRARLRYGDGLPETIASCFTDFICARKRDITPVIVSHLQSAQA